MAKGEKKWSYCSEDVDWVVRTDADNIACNKWEMNWFEDDKEFRKLKKLSFVERLSGFFTDIFVF